MLLKGNTQCAHHVPKLQCSIGGLLNGYLEAEVSISLFYFLIFQNIYVNRAMW